MFRLSERMIEKLSVTAQSFIKENDVKFSKDLLWLAYEEEDKYYLECFSYLHTNNYKFEIQQLKIQSLEEVVELSKELNKVLEHLSPNLSSLFNCQIGSKCKLDMIKELRSTDGFHLQQANELVLTLLDRANPSNYSNRLKFHLYEGVKELEGKGHLSDNVAYPYPIENNEQWGLELGEPSLVYKVKGWSVFEHIKRGYGTYPVYPVSEGLGYDGESISVICTDNYEEALYSDKDKDKALHICKLLNKAYSKGLYQAKSLINSHLDYLLIEEI